MSASFGQRPNERAAPTSKAANGSGLVDNLDILRRYLPDATDAQLLAFEDTDASALTGAALAVQALEGHASAI